MTDSIELDARAATISDDEVAHFSKLAADWWNPNGTVGSLHRLNPFRMEYMRRQICEHFGRSPDGPKPLAGLRVLDVGCGGGLVTEPMARLGATVVGIDPTAENIGVARLHARESGLDIDYRAQSAEALAAQGETFDVVTSLEVIEHVADVKLFVDACGQMVKPRALMITSTVNRTPMAYGILILMAEYLLRMIPVGTHHYDKFVTPEELTAAFNLAGLDVKSAQGARYIPLSGKWVSTRSLEVGYYMVAVKNRV